jgi:predicted dehydrogenase
MLEVARPDAVHITTPPQSHLDVGTLCLNAGCHVFFEKPFTLDATQAQEVIRLATAKNLKITVGHNNQFNPVSRRMRELVCDWTATKLPPTSRFRRRSAHGSRSFACMVARIR